MAAQHPAAAALARPLARALGACGGGIFLTEGTKSCCGSAMLTRGVEILISMEGALGSVGRGTGTASAPARSLAQGFIGFQTRILPSLDRQFHAGCVARVHRQSRVDRSDMGRDPPRHRAGRAVGSNVRHHYVGSRIAAERVARPYGMDRPAGAFNGRPSIGNRAVHREAGGPEPRRRV